MCGIAGIWGNAQEPQVVKVKEMMELMKHRGQDSQGVHVIPDNKGVFGHRRLAIIDPEGGTQPILSESGKMVLMTNGMIYNYQSLKNQIEGRHRFKTRSDSEVVLHLYEELGPAMVEKLDGMFAIALSDGQHLFLARDRIGIKPLYYGTSNGDFVFASELKALAGIAEDIQEFPPGTWYHSDTGFHTYFEVPHLKPADIPLELEAYLKQIRQSFEAAVEKRLISDVPVGTFLSGGLDSSLVTAVARKHLGRFHTVSVGIEGSRDIEAARIVSKHLDTIHHEYIFTMDEVIEALPEIIYYLESFDQDLVRSAIPCYFASRLAAEHVKVILTGEGADELFAGYTYYKDVEDPNVLHDELRRSLCTLHNINLQRGDRMTMAHTIEGRLPFLDVEMIEVAQQVPIEYKLYEGQHQKPVEKWILRKACEDLLPAEILWRDKEQFDEGSGTAGVIGGALSGQMSLDECEAYRARYPQTTLRSAEECVYHKMMCEVFPDAEPILEQVARWCERPQEVGCGLGSH